MNYFSKNKKWMAYLILLTFLFTSIMPTNLATGDSMAWAEEAAVKTPAEEQIVHVGDVVHYKDGEPVECTGTCTCDAITSKKVTATGVENEFNIELQVKTPENLETIPSSADAAVVLVIDTSGSMDYKVCTETHTHSDSCYAYNCGLEVHSHSDNCYGMVCGIQSNHKHDLGCYEKVLNCSKEHEFWQHSNDCYTYELKCDKHEHSYSCWGLICTKPEHNHNNTCTRTDELVCGYDEHTNHTETCGYDVDRIDAAREAAKTFALNFSKSRVTDDDQRLISIVSFASDAYKTMDWTNVTHSQNGDVEVTNINDTLNKFDNAQGNDCTGGGTNIEGGLQLAYNLIDAATAQGQPLENIDNVTVILLTDGCPTYHVYTSDFKLGYGPGASNITAEDNRNSLNTIYGQVGGSDWAKEEDYNPVITIANQIKGKLVNGSLVQLKTIALATGYSDFEVAGTDGERQTVKLSTWLQSNVSTTYAANNIASLVGSFEQINKLITLGTQAWILNDPMADNIVYLGSNGNMSGNADDIAQTGNTFSYYPEATDDVAAKTLLWNLKASYPTDIDEAETEDGTTWYTYTLPYRVRLENTAADVTAAEGVVTNKTTTLDYFMFSKVDGDDVIADSSMLHADLDVPKVKGHEAKITIEKSGYGNAKLAGAQFTLAYACTAEEQGHTHEAEKQIVSTFSDENGLLSFNKVPSGHVYTLTESTPPTDGTDHEYDNTAIGPYRVEVDYGEVTVKEQTTNGGTTTWQTISPVDGKYQITNKYKPETTTITVNKTWVGGDGVAGAKVTLYQNGEFYAEAEIVKLQDGSYKAVFNEVPVLNVETGKEYVYTVKETTVPEGFYSDSDADTEIQTISSENSVQITNTKYGAIQFEKTGDGGTKLEGAIFKLYRTAECTDTEITTAQSDGTGSVIFDNLEVGTYYVKESAAPAGYELGTNVYTATVTAGATASLNNSRPVSNILKTGSFTFNKIYENNLNHNQHAAFEAVEVNSNKAEAAKHKVSGTESNGTVILAGLKAGYTYEVTETSAPEGYNKATGSFILTVDENGQPSVSEQGILVKGESNGYSLVNTLKTGSFTFNKIYEDDLNYNQHAVFEAVEVNSNKAEAAKHKVSGTESNGTVILAGLKAGYTYEVTETSAPKGYVEANPFKVTVDLNGNVSVTEMGDLQAPTNSGDNYTLKNKRIRTSVTVIKNWSNVSNPLGKEVVIRLMNGTAEVDRVTLDGNIDTKETTAWTYKFEVPQYDGTEAIVYTVEEVSVDKQSVTNNGTTGTTKEGTVDTNGYYNVVYGAVDGKLTVTNSYVKDVTATKTWIDGNPTSRPEIVVQLYNDAGEVIDITPSTVTDGNVTTYTWAGVPATGTYTVKEISVGGKAVPYTAASPNAAVVEVDNQKYKVENNGLTITNTLLTDISGTKIWKNATNTWPKYPNTDTKVKVTVGLYVGDNVVRVNGVAVTDTLTGADDAAYSFANLPKYTAGSSTPIGYTVKELGANGAPADTVTVGSDTYKVSRDGNDIINTLTGDADITVTKTWVDDNNRDGLREPITVVLQQKVGSGKWANVNVNSLPKCNNTAQPVTKEIALSDNMSHTWYNVPLYTNDGAEILYRVVENDVTGYLASYSADSIGATATDRTIVITNKHVPETGTIKVEKVWDDKGLTVTHDALIFDIVGKVGSNVVYENTVTLNSDNNWTALKDVPKNATGQAITYLISERNVPEGYEVSYKLNNAAVNSDVVTWETGEKNIIGIILAWLKGENKTDGIDCTVTATNTLQTAGIKLTKAYSGGIFNGKTNVADGATFTLTGNGENITLTRDGAVYATTSAALKYGVVYTLHEVAPAGYEDAADQYLKLVKVNDEYKVVACDGNGTVLTGDNAAAYSLSNNDIADLGTITNAVVKGNFVFTKAFNSVATTPTFIVYEAVKDGDAYTRGNEVTGIVSKADMVYTISNLECGKSYEIVETAPGYEPVTFYLDVAEGTGDKANTAVVTLTKTLVANKVVAGDTVWTIANDAYTLTNQAQKTNLVLTKTYDGGKLSNMIGEKNAAVFVIKENGSNGNGTTVQMVKGVYTFENLEYGKTYTVTETAPEGYKPETFTIIVSLKKGELVATASAESNVALVKAGNNEYKLDNKLYTTSLTFDKVYVGPQPAAKATFKVTNNNDAEVTMSEGKYTISNLKYGYTYNVVENAPEGYVPVAFTVAVGTDGELTVSQTKADGYETIDAIETADGVVTVKNYLKQDKVDLFGTKSWIGGTTDSAIEIKLFRDGAEQATTTTSIKFNWKYIFAGLDRFNLETGKAYEYTVVETPLDGFTAHYDETVTADGIQIDITNVKDEETVAISGQKVWHDVAGTKHEPIEIALYRSTGTEDGKELVEKVVLSDEKGWTYNFGLLPKADPDSHIYYKYEVVELNVPAGYVSVVNGYDVHNIATPLYELGDISVTKKVVGTPANPNAVYDFVLYVKATVKGTLDSAQQKLQAVLVDDYLRLLNKELPAAEDAKEAAKAAFESSVFLTATSASAYTFFLTDESDNAVMGLTTGSAYYVEHVAMPLEKTESAPASLIGALITAIEELAEEFLNAIAEDPAAAKPTQSVMLSRIAQNSSVMKEAAAVNAVTTSAIAFKADNMQGLFDSVVTHKTTLQEYQDAKAAWEAFDTSVTTPTAIVLVVNGDFDNPIELDPEKGHQSETDENILEFTVENGEYTETVRFNTATSQYEIPFSLLKDETIKFNMKAATGSAIEYYIIEDRPVDDNYDHTDIKAYLYNGSLKDLENTMKAEEYLNTLTSTTSKLTSGSAATYEFYNHYEEDTPPGGGFTPEPPKKPEPPKPPEEIIDDPEVPLDAPEVPEEPVVVPGEEIPEPEVPLGDAPATGDAANAVPFMVLMMFALCGLVVTRRKFN